MSAAEMPVGAAPERTPDWHSIDWKKVWRMVRRLQARIVKAVAEGRWNKVKALVYLLTHSFSGRALAILRVVNNSGAKTPGVDGVLWNTPESKSAASPPCDGTAIDRDRSAGCTSPRATASDAAWGSRSVVHTAPLRKGVGDSEGPGPGPPSGRERSGPGSPGPMAPDGLPKLGDDLGRQADPSRAVRHRLDAVQAPRPAPGGDRGYVHIQ